MRATIKDVAKLAEVSTATVSNVLTGKKFVSNELEERINTAMSTLGYKPNAIARSLKINRSFSIGLMVPDITNPFFAEIVKYVQTHAYREAYQVTLCNSDNSVRREKKIIDSFLTSGVDGIINVAPRSSEEELNKNIGLPMVVVDRPHFDTQSDIGFVYADNYSGAAQVADYFIEKKYESFICFAGPIESVPNAKKRLEGFVNQLKKHGVDDKQCVIYNCDYTFEEGYKTMEMLLNSSFNSEKKQAIFACSDIMAWGAMEAAKAHKLKIPRDIAVVGYDNIYYSNFLYPRLTTVENPTKGLGETAINMLIEHLTNNEKLGGAKTVLESTLIIRNSA